MGKKQDRLKIDEILKMEVILVDGRKVVMSEMFGREDFSQSKDKELFIKHSALQKAIRKMFTVRGYLPRVVQAPEKSNEWCATVEVVYSIASSLVEKTIEYGATADCRTSTTSSQYSKYTTAMAETRASARALRSVLNIPLCSEEEIENRDEIIDRSLDEPIEPQQLAVIKNKFMSQKGKTLEDVSIIIGREIVTLEELSKGEAIDIITKLNDDKEEKED